MLTELRTFVFEVNNDQNPGQTSTSWIDMEVEEREQLLMAEAVRGVLLDSTHWAEGEECVL